MWEITEGFAAVGSGSSYAMAAMACGKGAREAVAIACKYDIYSKPPIHVVTLGKKPKIIKKK